MSELTDLFRQHGLEITVVPNHKLLVMVPAEDGPYDGMSEREILVITNLFQQLGQFIGYLTGSREKGRGVYLFPSQAVPLELLPFVVVNLAECGPELRRGMTSEEIDTLLNGTPEP